MQYPTISREACQRLTAELLNGADPSIVDREKQMVGGDDRQLDLRPVERLARDLESELDMFDPKSPKDNFEGQIAGRIHQVLKDIDIEILDDFLFWKYLALRHFWWLAVWREDAFGKGDPGKYMPYVDARNSTECVLTRVYLRGQIAFEASGEDENYELASAVEHATDFWRSHITRVNNWKYPAIVRAFVEMQRDSRLNTPKLRAFARALNRRRSSFWLREYTHDEAEAIIEKLRPEQNET